MQGHDDFAMAAPTPDHFIPLLYLAGLASEAGQSRACAGRRLCHGFALDDVLHARLQ